jgi:uroporphyrinogen-III decarboxylase
MKTLGRPARQTELDQVLEACKALRLDAEEAEAVLASHRACPWLLALYVAHGGNAADFVRARVEIRRAIRSAR